MKVFIAPNFERSKVKSDFPDSIFNTYLAAKDQVGVTHISTIFRNAVGKTYVATTYPAGWLTQYLVFGYAKNDPAVNAMGTNSLCEMDYANDKDPGTFDLFKAARSWRLGDFAVAVPINFPDEGGSVTTFTFADKPTSQVMYQKKVALRETAQIVANELKMIAEGKITKSLLTKRETTIIGLIADGNGYAEIAEKLEVSRWTVIAHARSFRAKLNARTNAEAVQTYLTMSSQSE